MMATHYCKYKDDDGEVYSVSIEDCYYDKVTEEEVDRRIKSAIKDRRTTGKSMIGLWFVIRPKTVFSMSF